MLKRYEVQVEVATCGSAANRRAGAAGRCDMTEAAGAAVSGHGLTHGLSGRVAITGARAASAGPSWRSGALRLQGRVVATTQAGADGRRRP
jgi:hypothetical protein